MFYLSLALILLGILIFVYSIIADAIRRRDDPPSGTTARGDAAVRPAGTGAVPRPETRRIRPPFQSKKRSDAGENRPPQQSPAATPASPESGVTTDMDRETGDPEMTAVLFEDNSRIIDYDNATVNIDPGLSGYKKIKRIGSGLIAIEKAGISFRMGKKLYRYDFHRVRDIKSGGKHLALFLTGSDSVKLFIFTAGGSAAALVADAYGQYLRSSE